MPDGYLCPAGVYALRVFMPCGCLCPAGVYALRVLTAAVDDAAFA